MSATTKVTSAAVLQLAGGFATCSACGGNASPYERKHVHGGPQSGWHVGSGVADENGCGAVYAECRNSGGEIVDWPVKDLTEQWWEAYDAEAGEDR